ncbi:hypothetical protein GUITHDRAFT_154303 [Guillardia theta CCMP2712]|uniref:Uncharacterized protein n=1 Tax=Guillardia theta (strain CCMP2712) TaxID=905079 RepID=L1IU98_GUITC|nr:hypothetical protein GUITHDRAFT_154303 [Guillardia theta CCMP2712]EKX39816.1 hypothetical protein GUITHDRAFT_154303 [Guillardia theta CCMP2712]|eukprot:XP_005826796.1 hypothetical protein GUITHDRAFT_154303 [Guillardia theta CCMP2712]
MYYCLRPVLEVILWPSHNLHNLWFHRCNCQGWQVGVRLRSKIRNRLFSWWLDEAQV